MPDSALASFRDLSPEEDDFLGDVLNGLSADPKTLPCKYFYDERGSHLFDRICELPEYYPTRTEMALMREKATEIADLIGPGVQLLEYGCGSIEKVRILLDALAAPASYIAVDISREHLRAAAETLAKDYPDVAVHALCADFSQPFRVPADLPGRRRVCFFPGSTIGNFDRPAAEQFLAQAAKMAGPGGGFLIGADLKKDEAVLHAAYNDSAGVTAAFNLNLLRRINEELDGDFDLDAFEHRAHYDRDKGRIEMHLVCQAPQTAHIAGRTFRFSAGETIHTESSHKYEIDEFQEMGRGAGFEPRAVWMDPDRLFSIHFFVVP